MFPCIQAGDKPEELYQEARQELRQMGYESTLEYVADVAGTVMRETGLLPHINAGVMGLAEVSSLIRSSCSDKLLGYPFGQWTEV